MSLTRTLKAAKGLAICLVLLAGPQLVPVKSQQIPKPIPPLLGETQHEGYRINLSRDKFTQGEPIVLRFVVVNYSTQPLNLNLGYNREGAFSFMVRKPDGTMTPLLSKPPKQGITRLGRLAVEPHDIYSQQLILNDWYDFHEAGDYEVTLHLKTASLGRNLRDFANARIVFEVTPFDSARLEQTCRELLKTITENVSNYATAFEAANALAEIHDPVVVRFLETAIKTNPMVEGILVSALERVANDEAVHVLVSILEHADPATSRFAETRSALLNLEKKISDPTSLELIRATIAKFPQY